MLLVACMKSWSFEDQTVHKACASAVIRVKQTTASVVDSSSKSGGQRKHSQSVQGKFEYFFIKSESEVNGIPIHKYSEHLSWIQNRVSHVNCSIIT